MGEKIIYKNRPYYINSDSINDPTIEKVFLYEDQELKIVAKNSANMTIMIPKENIEEFLKEYSGTGAGGAGYAVWGGVRGGFGNPKLGGGGSNLGGGPNVMYTYDVKPLNQLFQQPPTPQGDERYIHVGSEIEGKVLGKDEKVKGKIISSKSDEDGDLLYHIVQVFDTAEKVKVDPTSAVLITHEERPDFRMRDFVGGVHEDFYPSFNDYLNESKNDARASLKHGKLPQEIKEKVLKLGLSRYENGKAWGVGKPKIEGKSFNGVSMGADKNGFFVYTHRARSKSYEDPSKIPDKDINFIESTG